MRGGARPGSGPKRKALTDKIANGTADGATVLQVSAELEGSDMPPVKDFMKAAQKGRRSLRGHLELAQELRLRPSGESPAHPAVRHERGPMDQRRAVHIRDGLSGTAPHHGQRHRFALCFYEPRLHEAIESVVVSDFSGG